MTLTVGAFPGNPHPHPHPPTHPHTHTHAYSVSPSAYLPGHPEDL